MSTSTDEPVFTAALGLPADSRALLAEKLLESLDSPDQKAINAAWAEEAERRIKAFKNGEVRSIPIEDVMQAVRQPNQS